MIGLFVGDTVGDDIGVLFTGLLELLFTFIWFVKGNGVVGEGDGDMLLELLFTFVCCIKGNGDGDGNGNGDMS